VAAPLAILVNHPRLDDCASGLRIAHLSLRTSGAAEILHHGTSERTLSEVRARQRVAEREARSRRAGQKVFRSAE